MLVERELAGSSPYTQVPRWKDGSAEDERWLPRDPGAPRTFPSPGPHFCSRYHSHASATLPVSLGTKVATFHPYPTPSTAAEGTAHHVTPMARRTPQRSHLLTASRPAHGSAPHCPLHSAQHLHSPACVPRPFPLCWPNFAARQKPTRTSGDGGLAKRGCGPPAPPYVEGQQGNTEPVPSAGRRHRDPRRAPGTLRPPLPRRMRLFLGFSGMDHGMQKLRAGCVQPPPKLHILHCYHHPHQWFTFRGRERSAAGEQGPVVPPDRVSLRPSPLPLPCAEFLRQRRRARRAEGRPLPLPAPPGRSTGGSAAAAPAGAAPHLLPRPPSRSRGSPAVRDAGSAATALAYPWPARVVRAVRGAQGRGSLCCAGLCRARLGWAVPGWAVPGERASGVQRPQLSQWRTRLVSPAAGARGGRGWGLGGREGRGGPACAAPGARPGRAGQRAQRPLAAAAPPGGRPRFRPRDIPVLLQRDIPVLLQRDIPILLLRDIPPPRGLQRKSRRAAGRQRPWPSLLGNLRNLSCGHPWPSEAPAP